MPPIGILPACDGIFDMLADRTEDEWRARALRDWLLALLRFAITLEAADRHSAMVLARTLDAAEARDDCGFSFFRTTSDEVCRAIAHQSHAGSAAVLQRHLSRIADRRLRNAFAAVCLPGHVPPAEFPAKGCTDAAAVSDDPYR
jgi:hypothetical protein